MLKRNVLPIFLTALPLAGCATISGQPQASTAELRSALLSGPVIVQPPEKPVALAERTKARAVANTIVANMAANAAANTGNANSLEGMQANHTIASELGTGVARTLPETDLIKAGTGIDRALTHRLAKRFKADGSSPNGDGIVIAVDATKWEVGYESFLTSSDYQLDYDLDVHITAKEGDQDHHLKTIDCSGTFDRKLPLDKWRADDYREVDAAAHRIVDRCYELALGEMGMT
ncbi:MAG: hypothetical protein ACLFVH_12840 [Phycisphaerae bacterium]